MATINISGFKIYTPEPHFPDTGGDCGYRASSATTYTTGDTIITDPVSAQVFKALAPDPLNYETFRVVVAQPMAKTPNKILSPLTEALQYLA